MNVCDEPSPKSTFTVVHALGPLTVTCAALPATGDAGLTTIVTTVANRAGARFDAMFTGRDDPCVDIDRCQPRVGCVRSHDHDLH
jgi:hypothetical protein